MTRIFVASHLSNMGLGDQRNRTDLVVNLAKVGRIKVVALADPTVKPVRNLGLFPAINLIFAFPQFRPNTWHRLKRALWLGYMHFLRTVFLLYCLALMTATGSRLLFLYWPTAVEACWLSLLTKRVFSSRTVLWLNGHLELDRTHRVQLHYRVLRTADAVIIPTEGLWQYFLSRKQLGLAADGPHIIREDLGYISRSRSRIDLAKDLARKIMGISEGQKLVLSCARWQAFKGIHFIIALAPDLAKRGANLLIIISGARSREAPDYRAGILKEVERLSNVKIVEDVPYEAIPYYMRCADVLVLAAGDNYNDTFREAVVNGMPIVSFEAGLKQLGMDGIVTLVGNGDLGGLRSAVLAKLDSEAPPKELFHRWIERFSTERVASLLAARIRDVELSLRCRK